MRLEVLQGLIVECQQTATEQCGSTIGQDGEHQIVCRHRPVEDDL
jgi:hypothetical protein